MKSNPLNSLNSLGQSLWLDFIDRGILADGTLSNLIEQDDLSGLTSNPAIFKKAISNGDNYSEDIVRLAHEGLSHTSVYNELVLDDIARAADFFLPVYQRTGGRDGYVSIEVSPLLARDARASIAEARDLWARLQRPNIMIKIPGTREGLPAITTLLAEGINVNVTLLFSVQRYAEVLEAYMQAMEQRLAQGLPLSGIASVASFFLSRIDVKVDAMLDDMDAQQELASDLRGRAAIASAALAHRHYLSVIESSRWQKLADAGASVQRLLWASTGTKDPVYSDIKYVEPLIAQDTVNTLPMKTLHAYRDHGEPELRIQQATADADQVMSHLAQLEIDLTQLSQQLEEEGIRKFIDPYQSILATLEQQMSS
ncbi:MAG: transaldolase [Chromatiales bacterium]